MSRPVYMLCRTKLSGIQNLTPLGVDSAAALALFSKGSENCLVVVGDWERKALGIPAGLEGPLFFSKEGWIPATVPSSNLLPVWSVNDLSDLARYSNSVGRWLIRICDTYFDLPSAVHQISKLKKCP